ncbi:hypothetical protein [Pyrobaculum ferrireducens]|uniref:hypothetical protein n=1 Tax=Pyrobaculum ferrireducens TaxID=1104324 RepID=UPI000ADB0E6F|nr:hypothetical protein [Pyrobaculum ferrireducens]
MDIHVASIDIATVLSDVTSVASSSAALAYWLGRESTELNVKMRKLDARLENLSNAFIQF